MIPLKSPDHLAPANVFLVCAAGFEPPLCNDLQKIKPTIATHAKLYKLHAMPGRLDLQVQTEAIGSVSVEALKSLYTRKMAKKGSPGRATYDELKALAPFGRCPLCGIRWVATLDHFLPKSLFSALTVVPWNLVPSCRDCNSTKGEYAPKTEDEVLIHPYFDNIDGDDWLDASVEQGKPSRVRFRISPPSNWPPHLAARTQKHFELLELGQLYSINAAQELVGIRQELASILKSSGVAKLKDELVARAASRLASGRNNWLRVTYLAWARSPWFLKGGFQY